MGTADTGSAGWAAKEAGSSLLSEGVPSNPVHATGKLTPGRRSVLVHAYSAVSIVLVDDSARHCPVSLRGSRLFKLTRSRRRSVHGSVHTMQRAQHSKVVVDSVLGTRQDGVQQPNRSTRDSWGGGGGRPASIHDQGMILTHCRSRRPAKS